MKIKKLNIRPKMAALILAGALSTLALTSCGSYDVVDMKYDYNKAIIFSDNIATIIPIEGWTDYEGEQFQIRTADGLYMLTSSYDTKIIDERETNLTAEEIVRAIKGDDVEIRYLTESHIKSK